MSRRLVRWAVIGGAAAVLLALYLKGDTQSDGDWARSTATPTPAFSGLSVHDARERARADGRLLIIDATAKWCPPCRRMEATTWRDPRVIDWIAAHAVAVQVDVDDLPEVARTLGIRAMPTVILSRAGEELDRATGLKPPSAMLAWLDRAQAAGGGIPESLLAGGVRYTSVPDNGSANAMLRYMTARGAVAEGRLDEALGEVEWLWAHGAEQQPTFSVVRYGFLVETMKTLLERQERARESFGTFLDAAQREIDADHVSVDVWGDWLVLCDLLGEFARVTTWYEQHKDADGSIDAGRYAECSWIADSLFALLVQQQRYAEAGCVYRSPTASLELQLAILEMVSDMPIDGAAGVLLRTVTTVSGARAKGEARLRELAAQLAATLIAAEREEQAIEVSEFLLATLDDAASRKALVARALEWARPLPVHARWYAEALELGADVEGLGPALTAGLQR